MPRHVGLTPILVSGSLQEINLLRSTNYICMLQIMEYSLLKKCYKRKDWIKEGESEPFGGGKL